MTTTHTVQPGQIYESCRSGTRIRVITVHDDPAQWGTALIEPIKARPTARRTIPVRRLNPPGARTGYRLIPPATPQEPS